MRRIAHLSLLAPVLVVGRRAAGPAGLRNRQKRPII
jgi:hypothetical protein